jgi:uncharacterized protein (DUF1499 family)
VQKKYIRVCLYLLRKNAMKYLTGLIFFILTGCSGSRPDNLGLEDGKLRPCPNTPNCVSTASTDQQHHIEPLTGTIEDIKKVISKMERVKIVTENENYLHVEFTSAIMRFVDDVEFYAPPGTNSIQVRSASRLGKSDLGVNRKRIEQIRTAMTQF